MDLHNKSIIQFKDGINPEEMENLHPALFAIIGYVTYYASIHNLESTITSIYRNDGGIHSDYRAVDMRSKTWSEFHIQRVCFKINEKFKDIAAISKSDGLPRACVYHKVKGGAYHFHLQVKP